MDTALERPGRLTAPERLSFALLLIGAAAVYCWNISINGWANPFYAAAAQAGSRNWLSWFFGSLDSENFITVDKPPASLWLMGLSGRVFGFSSTSMLIPQAMLAVATTAVLYFAARRAAGHGPGLVAGAVFALTPAVAVIFRYNNPDALMVFLMAVGGSFLVRALDEEDGRTAAWQLAACGTALGFAFLAKMLEGLIVLPAFGLAYLVAGHGSAKARFGRLLVAAAALVVSAGWWVLAVTLTPSSARPYVGGSTDDTEMDLVLGYNGLQRVLGGKGPQWSPHLPNSPQTHRPSELMSQHPGLGRLFTGDIAAQIDWFLPTALIALLLGVLLRRRAPRTDLVRACHILWGGWLLTGFFLFSFMRHGMHTYYVVALAPPIAATIGVAVGQLWQKKDGAAGAIGLAALSLSAGATAFVLLNRNPSWHPPLRWGILGATIFAAALLLLPRTRNSDRLRAAAAGLALLVGFCGGGAYVLATVASPKTGGSPSAGPNLDDGQNSAFHDRMVTATPDLVALLRGAGTQWSAAVERSSSAANLELASGTAVVAIGGFLGTDPAPTPDEFVGMAKAGKVRYFLNRVPSEDTSKGATPQEAACTAQNPADPAQCGVDKNTVGPKIQAWVKAHAPAPAVIGNVEVYDLRALKNDE